MSEPDDGPVVGLTGARFGGAPRRKRRAAQDRQADPPPTVAEQPAAATPEGPATPPADPAVGLTGARFGRAATAEPEPADTPTPSPRPRPRPAPGPDLAPDEDRTLVVDGIRVRPYVLTGGRTRASRELPIETLVSMGPRGAFGVAAEQRQVVDVCAQPRSIAEVAALVGVPLGVARVLVADLADSGAVTVHATAVNDLDLMRRVLAGLHRL